MVQATRLDSRGIQWRWDMNAPIINSDGESLPHRYQHRPYVIKARRESFPSGSARTSASSTAAVINSAGPSVAPNELHNPGTVNTVAKVRSKVGNGKGKETFGVVTEHRQHTGPLSGRCPLLFPPSTPPHFLRSQGACSKQESGGTNANDPQLQCGSSTATADAQNEWANPTTSSSSHLSASAHPSTCGQHLAPCCPC